MHKFKKFLLLCGCLILIPGEYVSAANQKSESNVGKYATETPNQTEIPNVTQPPDVAQNPDVTQPPDVNPNPDSDPMPSSIPYLSQEEVTMVYGEEGFVPKIEQISTDVEIAYESTDTSIATIDDKGVIIPQDIGNCEISITITDLASDTEENIIHTLTLSVTVVSNIKKITFEYLESPAITLAIKQTRRLCYSVSPDTSNIPALLWNSSNPKVASVTEDGIITAKKQGITSISVSLKGDSDIKVSVKVKVTKRNDSFTQTPLSIVNTTVAKYTYTDMDTDIKQLVDKYGDRISVESLGTSYDNRTLYQISMGNPKAKNNIIINASIHAREYITSQLTMKQLEYYCANYYTGTYKSRYYSELFDDVCIYLVPMVNPDGVTISQSGSKGIKNAALRSKIETMNSKYGGGSTYYYTRWKANARGVDLNRNFSTGWKTSAKQYKYPANAFYKGTAPASEKETQAIIKLINLKKPKATINYHATGSILYWYFGQKGELLSNSKKLLTEIKNLTKYAPVNGRYDGKNAAGLGDWTSVHKGIPTVTIEVGKSQCPVQIYEFPYIWSKNREVWAATASLYD